MPALHPASTRQDPRRGQWPAASTWLPGTLLGAGLLLGLALWSKWGFAVAFQTIRSYCF